MYRLTDNAISITEMSLYMSYCLVLLARSNREGWFNGVPASLLVFHLTYLLSASTVP